MNESKHKAQSTKRESRMANGKSNDEGGLKIDTKARRVWVDGQEIRLTKLEYDVLLYLAQRAGQVVRYEELWHEVWRHTTPLNKDEQKVVRQAIKRVRSRLGEEVNGTRYLYCVRDVGFRFESVEI